MNTVELLTGAREYIAKGYCKNIQAVDRKDRGIYPTSHKAVAWCAYGAGVVAQHGQTDRVQTCIDGPERKEFALALSAAVPRGFRAHKSLGFTASANRTYRFIAYNNHPRTTQADMLALFDRAIELAKQEAQ